MWSLSKCYQIFSHFFCSLWVWYPEKHRYLQVSKLIKVTIFCLFVLDNWSHLNVNIGGIILNVTKKMSCQETKKFHLRSVFTPSYTSNSLSLMVWWQNVVLYAPTELNSSIPTEGTDVPEELTKTVTDKWVIQGSSCWTVLNI